MLEAGGQWNHFDLELFCQLCGHYLTSRTGVVSKGARRCPSPTP